MTDTGQTSEYGSTAASPDQGDGVRDKVAEGLSTVKEEAASFAQAAQQRAGAEFEDKKESITTGVHAFADAIRHAADELAQNDQTFVAKLVKQAADGLEGLSRSVSDADPEVLLGRAREFGRSNPTAFLAASVLAGVAIGRFARSSASAETSTGSTRGDGAAQAQAPATGSAPDLAPWESDPATRSSSPIQSRLEPADPNPSPALDETGVSAGAGGPGQSASSSADATDPLPLEYRNLTGGAAADTGKPYETGWGENPPPGEVSGDTQRRDI